MTAPQAFATDYDVYEVAFLAGGPRRAVDTAVVALIESGRVHVSRLSGELSVVRHRRWHSVEAAVLDVVGQPGEWSIDTVRRRLESDERIRSLGQRLERDGLLTTSAARPRIRIRQWRLLSLTGEGRRTLRQLQTDPPPDRVAGETSAMAVALGGTRRMADRGARATVFEPAGRQRARGRLGAPHEYAIGCPASHGLGAVGGFGGLGGGDVGAFGGGFCGGSSGGGHGGSC